jgi:hypothetical protein
MKKIVILNAVLLICMSVNASVSDTLAFWDFEGVMVDGVQDPYAFYRDDEVNGTARAWVLPNVSTSINATQSKFSAYREGIDTQGAAIAYYAGVTRGTTTILGASCLAVQSWNNTDLTQVRYWYLENLSTTGFDQINVKLYLTCAGTGGPGKFSFGYKIGDGAWIDSDFKDVRGGVTTTANWVGSSALDLWSHDLPATCSNQPKISCRWRSNDLRADNVTAISASSYSRLDNVLVSGTKATGISRTKDEHSLSVSGNRIIANTETVVEIYNLQGLCLQRLQMKAGETKLLEKGFYLVKTPLEKIKVLIQ